MIRPIDIRLNAAHPELPLVEATTFTGAPSSVFIRGVPRAVGNWSITAVSVAVTYPDNSTTTRAAVESAEGVWVATIPGTATSGRTANGLRVIADGIDENGAAVMGYILGVADFAVASLAVTPAPQPGETSYQMLYFDAVPGVLRKGDVTKVDGVLKFYNGEAWEAFATPPTLDDAVTRTSANGVKSSGIWSAIWGALSALPTGFSSLYDWCVSQLAGKASTADATLAERGDPQTPGFSEWQFGELTYSDPGGDGWIWTFEYPTYSQGMWTTEISNGPDFITMTAAGAEDATTLAFTGSDEGITASGTLTRTALPGYQLGSDDQHILASEAEAEALRTAVSEKYAKPSGGIPATDLAAAVQTNLGKIDAIYPFFINDGGNIVGMLLNGYRVPFGYGGYIELNNNGLHFYHPAAHGGSVVDYTLAFPFKGGTIATVADIPYSLGTPIVINTASSEVVEGETVYYGAATLADRTANIVQVTAATPLDELRITFPAATSGKVRDFGLRVEIGTGSAALAAPALIPIAPTGETIKIENNAAEIPAPADGTATAKGVTLLYFSETSPGVFVVKGEQVEEVA